MKYLTDYPEWQRLQEHHQQLKNYHIRDLFKEDENRFETFSLATDDLFLDFSKNRINEKTLSLFSQLATACNLGTAIDRLSSGGKVNFTEKQAALHTALRDPNRTTITVDNENISALIQSTLEKMQGFVSAIHEGKWCGYSGEKITDIVNIGIGGSDLGPLMATHALQPYHCSTLRFHFVSNIDASHLQQTLNKLNPSTTLFIVSSKSFSTIETLGNAESALNWFNAPEKVAQHFVAVTANKEKAAQFGIPNENIFPLYEWIGGRFSLWSAIGLPVALAIGMKNFRELLAGAYNMDQHFQQADFSKNMPVILALLGIWYRDFFQAQTQAILPYDQLLLYFPAYLKQLCMESNGKQVRQDATLCDYPTGPIVWGEIGCNGQHAFHQLLLQGSYFVPADFIISLQNHYPLNQHHEILFADCLSQSEALMRGNTLEEAYNNLLSTGYSEQDAKELAPHKVVPGNQPSNTLVLQQLTPHSLGALVALYEHKTFVQATIWGINPFDQWGVELGKQFAKDIFTQITNGENNFNADSSTKGLINMFRKGKGGKSHKRTNSSNGS